MAEEKQGGGQQAVGSPENDARIPDYARFGEHVASVLKAAEAAAERFAADARQRADEMLAEARTVRAEADAYSEQKQRDIDAQTAKMAEAAELAAARRVQEARQRNEALHKDLELTETRLRDLVSGLRTLASHLDDLLAAPASGGVDEALRDSLGATVGANASAHGDT